MGIFDFFKSSKEEKINNSVNNNVQNLANKYVQTYFSKGTTVEQMDTLSEEVIEMALYCWRSNDTENYRILLSAAEETAYYYHGSKYSNTLVEDIIIENR